MFRRKPRGQFGFTLIEVLAALTVFTIVTLGTVPVMISSMRGASLSRSFTRSKNVAVEAMERIRGLPFFESVGSVAPVTEGRVDVLDLYFPNAIASGSSGYQAAEALPRDAATYVTTCTSSSSSPAVSGGLACPKVIPTGHTVTFWATFVSPLGAGFQTEPPAATYNWNSSTTETAPSQLLKMVITVSWMHNGKVRNTALTTLLGERDVAEDKIKATAHIGHVVEGRSGYSDSSGTKSILTAVAGSSESRASSRTVASADQTVETGRLTLQSEETASSDGETLAEAAGASISLHAPPNSYLAPNPPPSSASIAHPDLGQTVAGLGSGSVVSSGVKVETELPTAEGGFTLSTTSPSLAVLNDPGPLGVDELHLAGNQMLTVDSGITGTTKAFASDLIPSAARKVESTASAAFAKLRMLPTDFISLSPGGTDGSVIVIENFTASLTCRATATVATSTATGTWTAKLKYWEDKDTNDGGTRDGRYVEVQLSGSVGSTAGDPLESLMAGANPLVYDDPDPTKRLYLFNRSDEERGYLSSWKSEPTITPLVDTSGRDSSVELADVIQITSSPVNPTVQFSTVTASVGTLSCGAVDKRGL
jgi:prepilin-type N-terminal cleavage/methylation domain-containing protein